MNPDHPNANEEPDTTDKTVPPYDDRKERGSVDNRDKSVKEGARTAGATGPVEDDEMKSGTGSSRDAEGSPADEQPAGESGGSAPGEAAVGPAHQSGTPRGEDRPEEE